MAERADSVADSKVTINTFLTLHQATGARLNWGLVSGGTNIKKLTETAKVLARAAALQANK
jgi:hypothetical protein